MAEVLRQLQDLAESSSVQEALRHAQRALEDASAAEEELSCLHGLCWAQLHGGSAELQPWREVFALCCLLRAGEESSTEALRSLDLGLILGGPETVAAPQLFDAAQRVAEDLAVASKKRRREGSPLVAHAEPVLVSCGVLERPLSLETFLVSYLGKTPVKVPGACADWPAVRRWAREEFWTEGALGQRFVPIEKDYWMENGFGIEQLRDFIQHCKAPAPGLSRGGYLAQHALLEQLPSLQADVMTPELALCGGTVLRQVFFGPSGTVTPLHTDPYENIFCQVVGWKYLRLYAPSQSHRLYPREGDMKNNSRIDPPDLLKGESERSYDQFPALAEAEYMEAVLGPGDLLYLPMGWWHFVKSLSISISVAFHFT